MRAFSYLKVNDLRKRLADAAGGAKIKRPRKREDLIKECLTRGLITKQESLVERSDKNTRFNLLTNELKDRGYELRNDSRLCKAYLEGGVGDPANIANTMTEMKFYFEHTDYKGIMDAKYNEACKEMKEWGYGRPPFCEFWNNDEASWDAKEDALKRWVATSLKKNPQEDQASNPVLPPTLRISVEKHQEKYQTKTTRK